MQLCCVCPVQKDVIGKGLVETEAGLCGYLFDQCTINMAKLYHSHTGGEKTLSLTQMHTFHHLNFNT